MHTRSALLGLVLLSACGTSAAPTDHDAGQPDTPSPIPDTGSPDTGSDAGTFCAVLAPGSTFDFLPDAWMPRCSAETRAAFAACDPGDTACRDAALRADTTPSAMLDYLGAWQITCGMGGPTSYRCIDWQTYACLAQACPSEYAAFANCRTSCDDEGEALVACSDAAPGFGSCLNEHLPDCFAP